RLRHSIGKQRPSVREHNFQVDRVIRKRSHTGIDVIEDSRVVELMNSLHPNLCGKSVAFVLGEKPPHGPLFGPPKTVNMNFVDHRSIKRLKAVEIKNLAFIGIRVCKPRQKAEYE